MKVVFAATSDIAIPTMERLFSLCDEFALLTGVDKPIGRGQKILFSQIKERALQLGVKKIFQFEKLDATAREEVAQFNPDFLVSFAYGKIFGKKFLSLFSEGAINIHPSKLPKYRGASPLTSSLLNGDESYFISIQKIFLEVDSGDILAAKEFPILEGDNIVSLTKSASDNAAEFLASIWGEIGELYKNAKPQSSVGLSYSPQIEKGEGVLDFNSSALLLNRKIKAFCLWPKCFCTLKGQHLYIYEASYSLESSYKNEPLSKYQNGEIIAIDFNCGIVVKCGEGVLYLKELQLQSKKRMDFKSFVNGNKDLVGLIVQGEVCE